MARQGEYTFYPEFQEYIALYRGVVRVWIGDGQSTGDGGVLYAEYIDGLTQRLGPVSSYAIAVDQGYDGTQQQWYEHIASVTQYALDAEAYATGERDGVDVPSTDIAYHNNARYYSDLAGTARTAAETAKTEAQSAKTAAETARTAAQTAQSAAETARTGAEAAQSAAESAQTGAETAEASAETAQGLAETAQTAAETAQGLAEAAQTAAETARTGAQTARTGAETARTGAETAQAAAESARSSAQSSQSAAETARDSAIAAKTAAETAQTAAEAAQTAAETAQGHAEDEAEDAEAWAVGQRNGSDVSSSDATYHNNSKYYSEQAGTSASSASTSASNASASEANALTYKNSAQNSMTAAQTAQGLAETAQTAAETAQTGAQNAQAAAETAQTAAESAQTGAVSAKTAAETARDTALSYRDTTQGYMNAAGVSAQSAADSASGALLSATNASNSATAAATSESNASTSATNAATSATNASNSATAAAGSATDAEGWATGGTQGEYSATNNSKYYAEQAAAIVAGSQPASTVTTYQNSLSGTTVPTGTWTTDPDPQQGMFTWSKTVLTYVNGNTDTIYIAAYSGVDGNVNTVNGYHGDVVLYYEYTDLESFPAAGEASKVYIAKDTNIMYRWDVADEEYKPVSAKFEDSRTFTVQGTVTNASGLYTHNFTNAEISYDSKAIGLELGNPGAFRDEISVVCQDGYATVSCNDVVGSSTIKISFFKSVYPVEDLPDANGVSF